MAKINLKFISRRARSVSPGASLRKSAEVPIKIKQQKANLPAKITNIIGQRKALENYGTVKWVSAACDALATQPNLLSQLPAAAQTGRLILHLTEEDPDTGDVCTLGRWKLGLCDGKLTYLSYQHQDPIHNSLIIYANDEQMIQILSGRLCLQGADALGTAKITGNCQIRNIFPELIKILNREINNPSQII
ncbi:unnamed protein product [Oikopleura dioica]|uniref:SCP2 domain-containing protein n=1 Tax=Oikopleura dioica TaxID=34765 RepID=E4XWE2_OIKDI|nr:unnamed protein product [Oikopleura dioica]